MRFGRLAWPTWVWVGLGAVVVVALGALLQFAASRAQFIGSGAQTLPCSPQPCLDVHDYTMWISNVTQTDGVVKMDVTFRNASDSTHATPEDLELVDARNQTSRAVQDAAGCSHWSRTEFGNGAKYGPVTICFRPTSFDSPLTLRWTPDFGLLCCEADLKLK